MNLIAQLQHMAEADISAIVDKAALDRAKGDDEHPTVKVYRIAHEGEADGVVLSGGSKVRAMFRYVGEAIQRIFAHLKTDTPLFRGHADDNSHVGRTKIGTVVGKALKEVNGQLQAFAATYLLPEYAGEDLDVASIEAPFRFVWDNGAVRVTDVTDITGIALGNSKSSQPAFSGATLVGAMQMFAEEGGDPQMTVDEIRKLLAEGGHKPSDVFDSKTLLADPIVHGKIEQTGFEAARRIRDEEMTPTVTELQKKKEAAEKERDEAKKESLVARRDTVFSDVAGKRKLTDQQKEFISKNWDRFKSEAETEEDLRKELDEFVGGQISEYKEYQKLFSANGDGQEPDSKETPTGGTKSSENPLIVKT